MRRAARPSLTGVGVVDAKRLKRFMSEPQWSAAQTEVAELLCVAVEQSLEAALYDTFITPRPWTETARILAGSSIVDTTYPVFRVVRLDGGPELGADDPLPEDYLLQGHRLYHQPVSATADTALAAGWPFIAPLSMSRPAGQPYAGAVRIEYMAGWGDAGPLVLAILRKAQTLMGNRHDDTMTVRALDAQAPPKLSPEDWSDAELKALGKFRRLGVGGR